MTGVQTCALPILQPQVSPARSLVSWLSSRISRLVSPNPSSASRDASDVTTPVLAERSDPLVAPAVPEDEGVVEGLESTEHSWVIGFQANLESCDENPKAFGNIFIAFVERLVNFHKLYYKS